MDTAYTEEHENGFIMLGVVHKDESGYKRLLDMLDKIAPEIITLEFTHYGLNYRIHNSAKHKKCIREVLLKHPDYKKRLNRNALKNLLSFANMPYEYRAAKRYLEKRSVSLSFLHLIDFDFFSYMHLQKCEELFSPSNVEKLLFGSDDNGNNSEKAVAKMFFESGVKIFPYTEEMFIRDKYMSNRISMIKNSAGDIRLLHICGWQHLDDPCRIYAPLNPRKVFIYDKAFRI